LIDRNGTELHLIKFDISAAMLGC